MSEGIDRVMKNVSDDTGAVIIGRNEGVRLKKCIQSIAEQIDTIVYVDSGSSDGSAEYVESLGVDVLRLNMTIPFSAARARNEGYRLLNQKYNNLKFVQFIDGDCECSEGWLFAAHSYLQNNETIAIVSGRRNEKYPKESIYNLLCDVEWDTPIGVAEACGGDFMVRKGAFNDVGGFNSTIISGEEPEMCYRLRGENWSIYRLDYPMTTHDAAITRFSQWWKRCIRSGHGSAQGFLLHLQDGKGYCFRESVRIWFWAFIYPVLILSLTLFINTSYILLASVYLIQFIRILFRSYKRLKKLNLSFAYSFFIIIGKWPEFIGQLLFYKKKILGQELTIIEYNDGFLEK